MAITRICVFCGSSSGSSPKYHDAALRLADELVARRIDLVYGGGAVGLMGTIADAMLERGGHVIGVIPEALVAREIGHQRLPDLRKVGSMHERKALMAELADAFIGLPGGFGTIEEFCEVVTWTQLGLHRKHCGLLNVAGFYDPLLAMFDKAVEEGFLKLQNRQIVVASGDPVELLDAVSAAPPSPEAKWIQSSAQI